MADMIDIACPECGKQFQVPATAAGKKVRCKTCGEVIPVAGHAAPARGPAAGRSPPGGKASSTSPAAPTSSRRAMDVDDDGKPYGVTDTELSARCPECANAMGESDIICLKCGYNVHSRQRVGTKKLLHQTSFDIFLWLLPGILCALVVLFVLIGNILFLVKVADWFPEDHYLHFLTSGFVRVWLVVPSLFVIFFSGKFAIKRLIFHPEPPEVELR